MAPRIGTVTAAMIGIVVLAGLLTIEAARTAREHSATAERVLLDYTALGAEGVTNRLQESIRYRVNPILNQVSDPAPGTAAELVEGLSWAAELIDGIVWSGILGETGPVTAQLYDPTRSLPPALADSIRSQANTIPQISYFAILPWEDLLVVFAPLRGDPASTPVYAIERQFVGAFLEEWLEGDPVLPASLRRGENLGEGVAVQIDFGGQPLAVRGSVGESRFQYSNELGQVYGGMRVRVALDEAAAPALVIGGLPRSRLPFLLGVLALTLVLAGTAAAQHRQRERLLRLRQDFVAGASHELRTPLAQIRLFAETLRLKRVRSEEEQARALSVVERETRRLEHLVDNLLHFSHAERGTLQITTERIELAALTGEIVSEFLPLAEKVGVTIEYSAPVELPTPVDPSAWRQVVLNLLGNAVKYGGNRTVVTVTMVKDGSHRRLSVADQGPGVPPGERELVWDRFWRSDQARSAGIAGTGIGLATVRDLVELHSGDCWVEGGGVSGAVFIVRVPEGR